MSVPESHLAQEAIAALVDGELPSGPAGRAARHLAGCGQCRLAVQAQREAKEALHRCADVAVPGDLLSRLREIPFTAEVAGTGSGALSAGPGQLTLQGVSGSWSVPLGPPPSPPHRPGQARWLRRGMAGALAGLGLGVTVLALNLPAGDPAPRPPAPVAGSFAEEGTEIVPPVIRRIAETTGGAAAPAVPVPGTAAAAPGGTP